MKKQKISALKIAAVYIGTVVGAGFATGQEVVQFFNQFGIMGLPGILLTTVLFIWFGYIIMELGRRLNAASHLAVISYSSGRVLGKIIDFIITFFLFGSLTAMTAGTGALFSQQLNLPESAGAVFMVVITALTVLTGINGVINSISFVVPFLLAAVLGTGILSLTASAPDFSTISAQSTQGGLVHSWILSAVLYVSYNTTISVAVLGPLGNTASESSALKKGALLGGAGLGMGTLMLYLVMSGNSQAAQLEVPMLFVAGKISPVLQLLYAVVLIAEIYTTAVGSLYGFVSRLTGEDCTRRQKTLVVFITAAASLGASRLGFSNLVKYLYPLVGYAGILLLLCLVYTRLSSGWKK